MVIVNVHVCFFGIAYQFCSVVGSTLFGTFQTKIIMCVALFLFMVEQQPACFQFLINPDNVMPKKV